MYSLRKFRWNYDFCGLYKQRGKNGCFHSTARFKKKNCKFEFRTVIIVKFIWIIGETWSYIRQICISDFCGFVKCRAKGDGFCQSEHFFFKIGKFLVKARNNAQFTLIIKDIRSCNSKKFSSGGPKSWFLRISWMSSLKWRFSLKCTLFL